jgi:hypothetical protein
VRGKAKQIDNRVNASWISAFPDRLSRYKSTMPTTTVTTTTTTSSGTTTTTTTMTTTTTAAAAAPVEALPPTSGGSFNGTIEEYEDPATLPFSLPASLEDVTAEWMTQLLQYRGMIPADVTVTSLTQKGVGMTAGYFSSIAKVKCQFSAPVNCPVNYVAKAWPAFELLPKEAIGNMFVNDIKGYSEYKAADFYPRPAVYLATYDVDKNLYALVMADAEDTGVHKVHENELTLDETKMMIPKLAKIAATFENCHLPSSAQHENASYVPLWTDPANLGEPSAPWPGQYTMSAA